MTGSIKLKSQALHAVFTGYIPFLILLCFSWTEMSAQEFLYPFKATQKKIIILQGSHYWDWSEDLKDNIENMQASHPYINGVVFHVGPKYDQSSYAFDNESWTENSLRFNELKAISGKWTNFTDNFILLRGNSNNAGPDFFDDKLWKQIITNTELLGKAVKTGGCKGIVFDPEFYSGNHTYSPWWYNKAEKYSAPYKEKGISFGDVTVKARQRGKEYVQALQKHMPQVTILTTFLYSSAWAYCYNDIQKQPDSPYALLASFGNGMLEGLNRGSILIDGNEPSYYIDETRKYLEGSDENDYSYTRYDATIKLCDATALKKWNAQGQVAMSPYLDNYYNIYSPVSWSTPEYQSKWMMHNVYNSLLASDQYVWVYIESTDFWKTTNTPAGVDIYKDIRTAVDKFRKGEALGYDMYKSDENYKFQSDKQAQFIYGPVPRVSVKYDKSLPGNVTIQVDTDNGTAVSKVKFYINSVIAGESDKQPYILKKWLPEGNFCIVARTFNVDGTHCTSAPLIIGTK